MAECTGDDGGPLGEGCSENESVSPFTKNVLDDDFYVSFFPAFVLVTGCR